MKKQAWDSTLSQIIGSQSDRAFSLRAGIGVGTISNIRRGRQEPNLETLRALAQSQGLKSWEVLRMVDGP